MAKKDEYTECFVNDIKNLIDTFGLPSKKLDKALADAIDKVYSDGFEDGYNESIGDELACTSHPGIK